MLTGKVDTVDGEISGIATATMHQVYLRGIGDINEVVLTSFLNFENAVGCEVYSHLAKTMPFEEGEK